MSVSSSSFSHSYLTTFRLPDGQPAVRLTSGALLPLLGFGTWGAGDSNEKIGESVLHALQCGYRHIDCAEYYRNQKEIGAAIKTYLDREALKGLSAVKRSDLFITTKVWNTNHRAEHLKQSVLKSAHDLQVQYLDLVLIHWPLAWRHTGLEFEGLGGGFPKTEGGELAWERVPLSETWRALEEMVAEGLVKSIGISNYPLVSIIDLLSYCRIRPAVHQIELHPYLTQSHLVEFCEKSGIHVSAYSPLGRPGRFENAVLEDPLLKEIARECSETRRKNNHNEQQEPAKRQRTESGSVAVSSEDSPNSSSSSNIADGDNEVTPAQLLLAWHILRNRSPLPKSSTPKRIESNFQSIHMTLTHKQLERMDALNRNHRYVNIVLTGPNAGTFGIRGETLYDARSAPSQWPFIPFLCNTFQSPAPSLTDPAISHTLAYK